MARVAEMDGTVVYPTAALRALVEEAVADESLSPGALVRELGLLRDEITAVLGQVVQRLGEAELVAEAETIAASVEHLRARENADLREELLRRGLASEDQLDALGYESHEELDERLVEAADLSEAAWGLGRLKGAAFNRRIRRARTGKFAETPDAPEVGKTIRGARVKRVLTDRKGRKHYVFETPEHAPVDIADATRLGTAHPGVTNAAVAQMRDRKYGTQDPGRRPPRERIPEGERGRHDTSRESHQADVYERRARALGRRTKRAERQGTAEDRRLGAGDLNPAGLVSQRRLLHFVREAASVPMTTEMHGQRREDGTVEYDADRKALHANIIDLLLRQRSTDGEYDPRGDPIPGQQEPRVLFMGGGYAAGKSSVRRGANPIVDTPSDAITIDPDEIKALLPEFGETEAGDPEANLRVYEEAWHVSQQLQMIAQRRRLNVVVDGISDSSVDEMVMRIQSFTEAGYSAPELAYVDVPTDVALERAAKRAQNATSASDRRHIPESIMRSVHRDVAAVVPRLMDDPRLRQLGARVRLFDTQDRAPKLVATREATDDGPTVVDEAEWTRFTAKATEPITGVEEQVAAPVEYEMTRVLLPDPISVAAGAFSPESDFEPGRLRHERYFNVETPGTRVLPLRSLIPAKDREDASVEVAKERMTAAARGDGDKRDPITVRRIGGGRFEIVDGNATYGAASDWEWDDVPVVVEGEGQGTLNPGVGGREETARAMIGAIHVEEPREKDQPVGPEDEDRLYELAEAHMEEFARLLDEGEGVGDELGGVTSRLEGDTGTSKFTRSLQRARENVGRNPEKAHVIVGALKGREKARGKAEGRFAGAGGWAKMTDLVRGSILVPEAGQVPQVVERLNTRLRSQGWRVTSARNGFARAEGDPVHEGPMESGYADLNLRVESQEGFKMEVQVHATPVWLAKEVAGGHESYDRMEAITRTAGREGRALTAVERHQIQNELAFQRRLYDVAMRAAFGEA